MRVLILSSCTGEKIVKDGQALTLEDFQKGAKHLAGREKTLSELVTPARDLYSGQQHVRLMRGVEALADQKDVSIDLHILSAGYGLVPANRKLAPYECTFQGMKKKDLRAWADQLGVPTDVRKVSAQPYDLGLVLLGDAYLEACAIDATLKVGGPTILFCGSGSDKRLPRLANVRKVVVTNQEAKRFSCGLVALKGELAARLLQKLRDDRTLVEQLRDPATEVLDLLDGEAKSVKKVKKTAQANPKVDHVIQLPKAWWDKPHRKKLRYFIPEWDDTVDPHYDFETDTHSGGTGDWSNEVYAHQMYPEPNYDGILISKVVAEKSKKKAARINALGVHRFLRVPREFPIMGDCGAFGYIKEENPPYTTDEILDYYTRLDFDYGVSIDHLIVTATEEQKKHRYDLTIHNAEEFLKEHKKRKLDWVPMGAVQGWDPKSYRDAAQSLIKMGYKYIALGGLVRSSTPVILSMLEEVHQVVPANVDMHLFGLARIRVLEDFARMGVTSVDSASYLRRAWMGTGQNYLTQDAEIYAAIRIPEAGKSFRAKRIVLEERATEDQVVKMEAQCFQAMRDFDAGKLSVNTTLDILEEYDRLITPDRPDNRPLLERTLEDAPWKKCSCDICKRDGVQVIIFRGNNRNRRRGFHNTFAFYRLFQRALQGEDIVILGKKKSDSQLDLF